MRINILAFTLILYSSAAAQVPTDGLVAYYPFNGNANDESGNENNGVVYGATLSSDRLGDPNRAYSFDGYGDYIICGNSTLFNGRRGLTITAFIYANVFWAESCQRPLQLTKRRE